MGEWVLLQWGRGHSFRGFSPLFCFFSLFLSSNSGGGALFCFLDTRGLLNVHGFFFFFCWWVLGFDPCAQKQFMSNRERERERTSSVNVHCREFVLVETFICFQNLMITMCFVNWCSSCSLYLRYHREVVRRRRKRRCTTAARWVGGRGRDQEG